MRSFVKRNKLLCSLLASGFAAAVGAYVFSPDLAGSRGEQSDYKRSTLSSKDYPRKTPDRPADSSRGPI